MEYGYENEGGEAEIIGVVEPDSFDKVGWQSMFYQIPREQMQILVCLYLGMKPPDIVKALEIPNIVRYYNASVKLRSIFRQKKDSILDYN